MNSSSWDPDQIFIAWCSLSEVGFNTKEESLNCLLQKFYLTARFHCLCISFLFRKFQLHNLTDATVAFLIYKFSRKESKKLKFGSGSPSREVILVRRELKLWHGELLRSLKMCLIENLVSKKWLYILTWFHKI